MTANDEEGMDAWMGRRGRSTEGNVIENDVLGGDKHGLGYTFPRFVGNSHRSASAILAW